MKLDDVIFILGAGASLPYGYPTARGLRRDIVNKYEQVLRDTSEFVKYDEEDLEDVIADTKTLVDQFESSNTESIDLFLTRTENKDFVTLGTQLIWRFIVWYELDLGKSNAKIVQEEDWYFEFFNQLTASVTKKELLKEIEIKIPFITFNYDRSLENYLFESFRNSFSLNFAQTADVMDKVFAFYHVYGKIMNLHWENSEPKTKFKSTSTLHNLIYANSNIKLIYNEREKIPVHIQDLVKKAKRIFILGFGFADVNLNVLNLKEILAPQQLIYGSGIGMHPSRIEQIQLSLTRGTVGIKKHNIHIEPDMNNLELLRAYLF